MPAAATLKIELPKPVQGFQPSTFLERGCAVPFTTPYLMGARMRPGERHKLELIIPNPAGGVGVYILAWDGVHALCSPTLHDRLLYAKLMASPGVTPGAVRRAACDVAAEGLAGREAAAAGKAAQAAVGEERLFANFELILQILFSFEDRSPNWTPPEATDRADLEQRTLRALNRLAPQLERPSEMLMTMIEELSGVFAGVGIGRQADQARLPTTLGMVDDLRRQLRAWRLSCGQAGSPEADLIETAADLTVFMAKAVMADARRLLADVPRLLMRWRDDHDEVARLAARPEWLLDGWERICLLWRTAEEGFGQPATLREMAGLVPVMPREARNWVDVKFSPGRDIKSPRRWIALGEDWRTGTTPLDFVVRNERLRALSPGGPA
jgi:hypothetical protein